MKQIMDYLAERKDELGITFWRLSASGKTLFAYDVNDKLVLKEKVSLIVEL